MSDKLTSIKGFGEGDPKPEKSRGSVFSRAKSKALEYRTTEGGIKKPIAYGRSVKGGGMNIKQFVGPKNVYGLSKNTSRSAGDVHGWKLSKKPRSETNL